MQHLDKQAPYIAHSRSFFHLYFCGDFFSRHKSWRDLLERVWTLVPDKNRHCSQERGQGRDGGSHVT